MLKKNKPVDKQLITRKINEITVVVTHICNIDTDG